MKKLIFFALVITGLRLVSECQAQVSFEVENRLGNTNRLKCGFLAFTNDCPPLVRYYKTDTYSESKNYTMTTGEELHGEYQYDSTCVSTNPVVGDGEACVITQSKVSGTCSYSKPGWSASGNATTNGWSIIGTDALTGDTTTNAYGIGCNSQDLDYHGSGSYNLGLWEGPSDYSGSAWDNEVTVTTQTTKPDSSIFIRSLDSAIVGTNTFGTASDTTTLSAEIQTSELLGSFNYTPAWNNGTVGSSMDVAWSQTNAVMSGVMLRVHLQGPKGNFRLPYVVHSLVGGIDNYATNFIHCASDGRPQYYPAGAPITINPPYGSINNGCSSFYIGGTADVNFLNFLCFDDGNDHGDQPCSQCQVCAVPGMPKWWVSEPYINLWAADRPVEYTTSLGENIGFSITYKQRDDRPQIINGQKPFLPINGWNNSGYSYVHFTGQTLTNEDGSFDSFSFANWTASVYEPGGGENDFSYNQTADPNRGDQLLPMDGVNTDIYPLSSLIPDGGVDVYGARGFRLVHPDGSQDIYGVVTPLYPTNYTEVVPITLNPEQADTTPVTWGPSGIEAAGEYFTPAYVSGFTNGTVSGGTVVADPTSYQLNPDWARGVVNFRTINEAVAMTNDPSADALLTEHIDPMGNAIHYNYTNTGANYQLQSVVDYDGKVTTFGYDTNGYMTNVSMPYGRSASFVYAANTNLAELLSVTDAQGMTSTFTYDSTGFMTSMTTPYGTTAFAASETDADSEAKFNEGVTRALRITNPDYSQELYAYFNSVTNGAIPDSYPTDETPTPFFPFQIDNGDAVYGTPSASMHLRDSFYWGRQQCALLSTTEVTAMNSLTPHDFLLGRMSHWKLTADKTTISSAISMTQEPSPDGLFPGQKTWYGGTWYLGNDDWKMSIRMRLQPDGSTWYERYEYDSSAQLNSIATTFTDHDGRVQTRGVDYGRTWYPYSEYCLANNHTTNTWQVDLLTAISHPGNYENIENAPDTLAVSTNHVVDGTSYTFTRTYPHWPTMQIQDPSGESDVFLNDRSQVMGEFSSLGLTTTNYYGPDGFLNRSIALEIGATNTYAYTNGLLAARVDPKGLLTRYSWDNLERFTGMTFPDGTTVSNVYTYLDVTARKDRLGNWSSAGYNNMQHMTSLTDRLGNTTYLDYCLCGGLAMVIDPLANSTTYDRNLMGWVTNEVFADANGHQTARHFQRDALGRATRITDDSGLDLTYTYGLQDIPTNISSPYGNVLAAGYNALDKPVTLINAEGVGVTNQYDDYFRLVQQNAADGFQQQYVYAHGQLYYMTDSFGRNTFYGYDGTGHLINYTDANNNTNGFTYTPAGQLATLADGNGHVTAWAYDVYGRAIGKTDGNGVVVSTNGYDADGRVIASWTPAKGLSHYLYDANGNLRTNTYSSGTNIVAAYDALNRLVSLTDAVGTSTLGYTNFGAFMGALASEDGPWASDTVTYGYGNRVLKALNLAQPSGSWSQSYSFDGLQRLQSLASPAGTFAYTYNGAGRQIANLVLPGMGNNIAETYDDAGQLLTTALKHGGLALDSYAYGYDVTGNRTNVVRVDGAQVGYGYDNIGQLTSAVGYESDGTTPRGNENFGYAYDPAGNLAVRQNNTLVQTYATDNADVLMNLTSSNDLLTVVGSVPTTGNSFTVNGQAATIYHDLSFAVTNGVTIANGLNTFTAIVTSNSVSMTNQQTRLLPVSVNLGSDTNGNLTGDGLHGFEYDCANELTRITVTNVSRTEFVYDGFGRRRIRREFNYVTSLSSYVQTNEVHYVYDGMTVIQERNSNNVPLVSYTRGVDLSGTRQGAGGIGGLLARTVSGGDSAFYHADGDGNITMLVDALGNVKARYLYDSFGNTLGMWGILASANTYRYSSKEMDLNSGLYYYGLRYYAPNLQRWLNRDPLGEAGGINLYDYVGNNPVNYVDPLGLFVSADPNDANTIATAAGPIIQQIENSSFSFGITGTANLEFGYFAGAGATFSGGVGLFHDPNQGFSIGSYLSSGAFAGAPNGSKNFPDDPCHKQRSGVLGFYAGFGGGLWGSNAGMPGDLGGPFNQYNFNSPVSASFAQSGSTWIGSLTAGPGDIMSFSAYPTTTWNTSGFSLRTGNPTPPAP